MNDIHRSKFDLDQTLGSYSPTQTEYSCENGYLVLNPRWYAPTNITLWKSGWEAQNYHSGHYEGFGYQYEAAHVMECLDAAKIEIEKMT
ncbi:MAG: hypothetical protein FP814_09555 [Desulfobacterium sp.]|nr:hypothetical protein [Desulfobacteraceae bacterium]MBA3036725.1 hypothetical protein [Desulfobacterium sp.]MBU4037621.1 hypothetical protein [Pseudomonadota bacterium]